MSTLSVPLMPTPLSAPELEAAPVSEAPAPLYEAFEQASLRLSSEAPVYEIVVGEFRIRDRVVIRLREKGIVREEQIEQAAKEWKRLRESGQKIPLWRVLTLQHDLPHREPIYVEAAQVYAFEQATFVPGETLAFLKGILRFFTEDQWDEMIEHFVIPIRQERDPKSGDLRWLFATHDPTRAEVHQVLRNLHLKRFELRYASEKLIATVITEAFLTKNEYLERLSESGGVAMDLGTSFDQKNELIDEEALEAEISRSMLINLFEATLVEAVHRGASDVHIFPNPDGHIEIHLRIDGELIRWHIEERVHPQAFLAVVKDNAMNVDRFERDMAQDGFIQRRIGDVLIRFRVSVLPIASPVPGLHAESIVIRVIDDRKVLTDLRKLGLLDVAMQRFNMAIRQPHGMVILTGPTGSGKSTTLVAALYQVISPKVNVLTVEDPVEYIIRGVRQIKLGHKLGLEGALRAILRHDPDIVMVGEMRDRETAELAIKLSNTGHLTFSTLHTNDAPSAITRLYKMGIEPFLIAYGINLVVAQRLMRKLCPDCKQVDPEPDVELMRYLGFSAEEIRTSTLYRAGHQSGCKTCKGVGYKGRRAVAETLLFSKEIRKLIVASEGMMDEDAIRNKAIEEGMLTLRDSARLIVLMGDSSLDEMMRITGSEE
jgi:type IV pilus assembly protein PilB